MRYILGILLVFFGSQFVADAQSDTALSPIVLQPDDVVVNETAVVTFKCEKRIDDGREFDVELSRKIPKENHRMAVVKINKTTIEIVIQFIDYVGIFHLYCFSKGKRGEASQADVKVGSSPGQLQLIGKCIVSDNFYVDCTILAPRMAIALQNGYPPNFDFTELSRSSSGPIYKQPSELIHTDYAKGELVFRFIPTKDGQFPSPVLMKIKAKLGPFNSTDYVFSLIPTIRITPNFTIKAISSNNLLIRINSIPSISSLSCQGNVTKIENNVHSHDELPLTLQEMNLATTEIAGRTPNTKYQICIECRPGNTVEAIIESECQYITTGRGDFWPKVSMGVVAMTCAILFVIAMGFICKWRTQLTDNCRKKSSPRYNPTGEIELQNQGGGNRFNKQSEVNNMNDLASLLNPQNRNV